MNPSNTSSVLSTARRMDFLSSLLVQKITVYFLLYLLGLFGIGNIYILIFFLLLCVWISIKTYQDSEAPTLKVDPWWLEDNLVERVDWINQIMKQFWPNFISFLQFTLDDLITRNGRYLQYIFRYNNKL